MSYWRRAKPRQRGDALSQPASWYAGQTGTQYPHMVHACRCSSMGGIFASRGMITPPESASELGELLPRLGREGLVLLGECLEQGPNLPRAGRGRCPEQVRR